MPAKKPIKYETDYTMTGIDRGARHYDTASLPHQCFVTPAKLLCTVFLFLREECTGGKGYLIEIGGSGTVYDADAIIKDHGPFIRMFPYQLGTKGDDRPVIQNTRQ